MTPAVLEAHQKIKAINARIAQAAARVQPRASNVVVLRPGELGERAFHAEVIKRREEAEAAFREWLREGQRLRHEAIAAIRAKHEAAGTWLLQDVLMIAAEVGGVSLNDLRSARRTFDVVRPRQTFCWLAKQFTLASFPQIGQAIGGRDHTTALYAERRVASDIVPLVTPPADDTPLAWAEALLAIKWPNNIKGPAAGPPRRAKP